MTTDNSNVHYYYRVFGLRIKSALDLPMLNGSAVAPTEQADVKITFGTAPDEISDAITSQIGYAAKSDEFLLRFKNIPVKYHITKGNSIVIDRRGHEDWYFIRLFLLSAGFGALLHQRGVIPLHAGGVIINGAAVLLSGQSGAGKSTTTAALQARGYTLIADDVAVIYNDADGLPIVQPGVPFVKLWKESFELLAQDVPTSGRIRPEVDKYFVPIEGMAASEQPIQRIYILEKSDEITQPILKSLSSIEAVHHLRLGTYRYRYAVGLGVERDHFQIAFNLGRLGRVKHLTRPMVYPLDKLVALIEADLKS